MVSPERSASATTIPQSKTFTAGGVGQSGQLADLASRIKLHDAEKARAEENRRREERDGWLVTHDVEFAAVRTRLKSMRVFAAMSSDEALKAKVRAAVTATESDVDALRSRVGDGVVGFSDAASIRSGLQARHEALAAMSEEYGRLVK